MYVPFAEWPPYDPDHRPTIEFMRSGEDPEQIRHGGTIAAGCLRPVGGRTSSSEGLSKEGRRAIVEIVVGCNAPERKRHQRLAAQLRAVVGIHRVKGKQKSEEAGGCPHA